MDLKSGHEVDGAMAGEGLESGLDSNPVSLPKDPTLLSADGSRKRTSEEIHPEVVDGEDHETIPPAESAVDPASENQSQALLPVAQSDHDPQTQSEESLPQTGERTDLMLIIAGSLLLGGVIIIRSKEEEFSSRH